MNEITSAAENNIIRFDRGLYQRFIDYTDRKDVTVRGYMTCIKRFASWTFENGITDPCREDIKAYRDYLMTESGLSVGTQAQYLRAVKHFFRWVSSEGIYPNIADNIHGPKVRHDVHKKDALQRNAVHEIAESIDRTTAQGKRLYAMYLLCITCGLRTVEIHRANIEDLQTVGGRTYLYIQGKGHDEKDAPVLVVPEVMAALLDYFETRSNRAGKDPLFTSTSNRAQGGRIATTTISTMLKEMLKAAGYDSKRLTAHSLRHTSGTGAYMATGNLFLAQKHQRHVDPATTEIYVHAEERENRNTEQQVYNYYFSGSADSACRTEARAIIDSLAGEDLQAALKLLKGMVTEKTA